VRRVIDYKIKWKFKRGKAVKLIIPIYKEEGTGWGLENMKKVKIQIIKEKISVL